MPKTEIKNLGVRLNEAPYQQHPEVQRVILEYYDGPLEVAMETTERTIVVDSWHDIGLSGGVPIERWVSFPVSADNFRKYLNQELSFLGLWLANEFVYVADFSETGTSWYQAALSEFDHARELPTERSYLEHMYWLDQSYPWGLLS